MAARKARGLVDAGAPGDRGGPRDRRRAGRPLEGVDLRAPPLPPGEVAGYRLVITATGRSRGRRAGVSATARPHGVLGQRGRRSRPLRVHPARRGPPGSAAGHLLHQRAQPGAGHLAAAPLRRRAGPGIPHAAGPVDRGATGCSRTRAFPPRALIGNPPSTRECWTSSARATSPKPRSASRRVCRRHRAEPPHRAPRPARADDHRRLAPGQGPARGGVARARERGGGPVHVQPHRDLRGGREVPRRLRRRARLPVGDGLPGPRGLQRPPLRVLRRGGRRPPVRGDLGARLGRDRRGRDPGPGAPAPGTGPRRRARSAPRST